MLDLLALLGAGVAIAAATRPGQLALVVAGGVLAAVLFFFGCSWFAQLWNRRIQLTRGHYVWCGLAAVSTVLLSVLLVGAMHVGEVASLRVQAWSEWLTTDTARNNMWNSQHNALLEAGYPQTKFDAGLLSLPDAGAHRVYGHAMAASALAMFAERNWVLHLLVGSGEGATAAVEQDVDQFFQRSPGQLYPAENAVPVMRRELDAEFSERIPHFQFWAIVVALMLAVLVQALPFALAAFSAYQQISVSDRSHDATRRRLRANATTRAAAAPKSRSRFRR